jgi:hypothetical protein
VRLHALQNNSRNIWQSRRQRNCESSHRTQRKLQ